MKDFDGRMETMPPYWWECTECGKQQLDFKATCGSRGIVHFLWDQMLPAQWDQSLLVKQCSSCMKQGVRITYLFDREEKPETVRTVHIVGIQPSSDRLVMMWETSSKSDLSQRWFDFKYVKGRKHLGHEQGGSDEEGRSAEAFPAVPPK